MLLTDHYPFNGNTREQCLNNYYNCSLSFAELEKICPEDIECRSLLLQLLNFNPNDRPSINNILQHSWFSNDYYSDYETDSDCSFEDEMI